MILEKYLDDGLFNGLDYYRNLALFSNWNKIKLVLTVTAQPVLFVCSE